MITSSALHHCAEEGRHVEAVGFTSQFSCLWTSSPLYRSCCCSGAPLFSVGGPRSKRAGAIHRARQGSTTAGRALGCVALDYNGVARPVYNGFLPPGIGVMNVRRRTHPFSTQRSDLLRMSGAREHVRVTFRIPQRQREGVVTCASAPLGSSDDLRLVGVARLRGRRRREGRRPWPLTHHQRQHTPLRRHTATSAAPSFMANIAGCVCMLGTGRLGAPNGDGQLFTRRSGASRLTRPSRRLGGGGPGQGATCH